MDKASRIRVGVVKGKVHGFYIQRVTFGRWSAPVAYIATIWITLQTINIAWPRPIPGTPWYVVWSIVITTIVLGAIGVVIYLGVRGRIEAPIGDRLRASVARMASAAGPATKSDESTSDPDPAESPADDGERPLREP